MINDWVTDTYNVQFELFEKIDVNGENTHPVYKFLKQEIEGDVSWNFDGKFLVDRQGKVVRRFTNADSFDDISYDIQTLIELSKSDL